MDLIEDFAFRLPVTVICDMLGIPEEHREVFYKGSRDGGRLLDPVPLTPEEIEQANTSNAMAKMYFQQLFELRRTQPRRRPDHATGSGRGSRRQALQRGD